MYILLSSEPADAMRLPSGDQAAARTMLCVSIIAIVSKEATDHSLMVLSKEHVINKLLGEKLTYVICSVWPSSVLTNSPVRESQIFAMPSPEPLAMTLSSFEKLRALTE